MIQAYSLFEGSFSVDASKKFVPFDPAIHNAKDRPASMFIHVHPFLIETSDGLVLCDTGLGLTAEDGELLIYKNIKKRGYEPKDVKYVLMSHLHKDHAGGMVVFVDGVARIAFPEAEYIVQRGEWEDAYSGNNDSYRTDIFDVVQRSGNLHLVEGDGIVNHEISFNLNGGHTRNHQAFHIETGGEHYFFGGDVLPEPEEIFHNYIAKYDYDGRRCKELRQEYWEEGAPKDWIYLFYHSKSIAVGKPALRTDGSYKLIEAK
ncbi:MBL fold metallo-hydrolase [Sphingobacterium sp. SRCM116780]|uniref:MBL fold metallo-hydrolase n=1 Tax=Sphingobacterium sp. SRCM116780 TaxID=2907623 RepID=UPI001F1DC8AB|nr:MBL fold metallo-hydrolase [Sphingobacterium sp. SRCM116780]UIR56283.1 MBL fold metallo-hydrolase [Sphingobacterium sp. SRCM116780]